MAAQSLSWTLRTCSRSVRWTGLGSWATLRQSSGWLSRPLDAAALGAATNWRMEPLIEPP
jgi:hypothetical protein